MNAPIRARQYCLITHSTRARDSFSFLIDFFDNIWMLNTRAGLIWALDCFIMKIME